MNQLGFIADGVVIKVNDGNTQAILGSSPHAPKWALAYKFPSTRKEAVLQEIRVQVGRTGALTPVGILKAPGVIINGVVIARVSLHNADEVNRLQLAPGCSVIIERAGDVIPQIVERVHDNSNPQIIPSFNLPDKCPVCNSPTVHDVLLDNNNTQSVVTRCSGGIKCLSQCVQAIE